MKRFFLYLLLGLILWIGMDLLMPRKTDFRQFDPDAIARLDADMWKSYYERDQD